MEDLFHIYWSMDGINFSHCKWINTPNQLGRGYLVSTLVEGVEGGEFQDYWFTVTTYKEGIRESNRSNIIGPIRIPLFSPTDVVDAIDYTRVKVKWKDNSQFNMDYEIEYKSEGGSWQSVLAGGDKDSVEITGLTPYTKYYFRVRAVDGGGHKSPWSRMEYGYTVPMWSEGVIDYWQNFKTVPSALIYGNSPKAVVVNGELYVAYHRGSEVIVVERVRSLDPLEAEEVYMGEGDFPTIGKMGGKLYLIYRKGEGDSLCVAKYENGKWEERVIGVQGVSFYGVGGLISPPSVARRERDEGLDFSFTVSDTGQTVVGTQYKYRHNISIE